MTDTYLTASRAVDAVISEATRRGITVSVAVVGLGGELVAFGRMDGAPPLSAEIARNKAATSWVFGAATRQLGELSVPGGPLAGIEAATTRPLVRFGGGLPVRGANPGISAIGVSGGTVEEDEELAAFGVDVIAGAAS